MNTQTKLTILRNIFYKSFIIGVIFLIIAASLYMPCKCMLASFYQTYLGISVETYYKMWVGFIGLIKTIIVFIFLIPGLAIHWVSCEKNVKNSD